MVKIIKRVKIYVIIALVWALLITIVPTQVARASVQMPFYNLQPKFLTVRSQFYTTYTKSPEERKTNVATAVKSLNKFEEVLGLASKEVELRKVDLNKLSMEELIQIIKR